jgi:hypothetical protein
LSRTATPPSVLRRIFEVGYRRIFGKFIVMEDLMEITTIKIENPEGLNFILGQSHFIKTVEDIYEIMVTTVPMAKFALAFCEASDKCLIRRRSQFYCVYERSISHKCLKRH